MTLIAIENGVVSIGGVEGVELPPGIAGLPLAGYRITDGAVSWEEPAAPAPTPAPAPTLSFLQFMDLFTASEQLAIAGAAMTDAPTKLWYDRAVGAQFIDLADPRLTAGLQVMVDSELLTASRRDRVIAGLPPED